MSDPAGRSPPGAAQGLKPFFKDIGTSLGNSFTTGLHPRGEGATPGGGATLERRRPTPLTPPVSSASAVDRISSAVPITSPEGSWIIRKAFCGMTTLSPAIAI